jgi:chromosome partitioning protein
MLESECEYYMAIVISCNTRKGGVGKSSLNYEISSIFSGEPHNYKTLLISTDDQTDLDLYVGISNKDNMYTFLDVLRGKCSIYEAVFKTKYNFDMIRSDKEFSKADREFIHAEDFYIVKDAIDFIQNEYDFIIFDSSSNRGFINTSILMASNYVILPAFNDEGSIIAILEMKSDIDTLRKRNLTNVKILGLVLNRAENTNEHKDTDSLLGVMADDLHCKHFTKIRKAIALDKAKRHRSPVTRYHKWSDISVDLRRFSNEIIDAIVEDLDNAKQQSREN